MKKDIRDTVTYREAQALYEKLRQPGSGPITDATEISGSPDGRHAVFAGVLIGQPQDTHPTRICQVDLTSGEMRVLTFGPNTDRLPRYSPDGRHIAFLSDRHKAGDFQLYLLDLLSGAARSTPSVEGWVEYLHWSADGKRIVLGVAGHGADVSGVQGAASTKQATGDMPSWMPAVEAGNESYRWRRAWIYELDRDRVRQAGPAESNIWEAVWCGNDALAAVVSPGSGEGEWFHARLHIIEIETGNSREVYAAPYQMGWPAASPSGKHLAIIEALCSDRWLVAGELRLIETTSGKTRRIDTNGVDITCAEWRSDQQLLLAGHRGFQTVVALCDAVSGKVSEVWSSPELSTAGFYVTVSGLDETGDCVLVGESFVRAPEIAVIRQGRYHRVKSFDAGYADELNAIDKVERVSWSAPDGLGIQGWLLRPKGKGPHPLVMNIHGGPVWHWRPAWLGRRGVHFLMLIKRGYALFFPNPRGSSGRGQDFVRHVLGDMGGADAGDCLSGLDHLVERGIADPARLGVTGVSYGGFMTSWLITQDSRFAAAVPVAPHTNFVTYQLLSNQPDFVPLFLADRYDNAGGKFFERSPIMHAGKVRTPTLIVCGALDRCTPPEEAVQFHHALLEHGVDSVLVTYPQEGHGVRRFPASIDYAARLVAWFARHMAG